MSDLRLRTYAFLSCIRQYNFSVNEKKLVITYWHELEFFENLDKLTFCQFKRKLHFLACVKQYKLSVDVKKLIISQWLGVEMSDFLDLLLYTYQFFVYCDNPQAHNVCSSLKCLLKTLANHEHIFNGKIYIIDNIHKTIEKKGTGIKVSFSTVKNDKYWMEKAVEMWENNN